MSSSISVKLIYFTWMGSIRVEYMCMYVRVYVCLIIFEIYPSKIVWYLLTQNGVLFKVLPLQKFYSKPVNKEVMVFKL